MAGARMLAANLPQEMIVGQPGVARLWVENVGRDSWIQSRQGAYVEAIIDGRRIIARPRKDTPPADRVHFVFSIPPFSQTGQAQLFIKLKLESDWRALRPAKVLLTMNHSVRICQP